VSVERIVNNPARSIGPTSWQKIERLCREHNVTYDTVQTQDLASLKLRQQQFDAFLAFQKLMRELADKITTLSPSQALELIVNKTGFAKQFNDRIKEEQYRLENIAELKTVTKRFDHLTGITGIGSFLEQVTLLSDQDQIDDRSNAVNMMTVHAAKGLEFTNVFITGMEEGLFPHARSLFNLPEMAEERRLCYVALTRAKERAYLVYATQRTVYGNTKITSPSRFLKDLPKQVTEER
jgi:DNA helicase-2/ATP-dependent DNA helicase PcrA